MNIINVPAADICRWVSDFVKSGKLGKVGTVRAWAYLDTIFIRQDDGEDGQRGGTGHHGAGLAHTT